MMTITRGLAVGAVVAGAALGLANPASAESLSGTYTATVTDVIDSVGPGPIRVGATMTWALTSCGADCTRLEVNPPNPEHLLDLHLQGNSWTGGPDSVECTKKIDTAASAATEVCPMWTIQYALSKTG
jgi:hypothetical protein